MVLAKFFRKLILPWILNSLLHFCSSDEYFDKKNQKLFFQSNIDESAETTLFTEHLRVND